MGVELDGEFVRLPVEISVMDWSVNKMICCSPKLGWRDVQHILVWTASPYPLYNNDGWRTNAAGFKVNHRLKMNLF